MKERLLAFAPVAMAIGVVGVAVAEHSGLFDKWAGLDEVQRVADRFALSYAAGASAPVLPTDPEWAPTIALIERYSKAKLRADKSPQTIARWKASLSTDDPGGFEWTSPSTPFAVLYRRYPEQPMWEDVTVVGTIGDLQNWIARNKAERHFLISDVALGVLGAAVALGQWLADRRHRHRVVYRPVNIVSSKMHDQSRRCVWW